MKLSNLTNPNMIILNSGLTKKRDVLKEMVDVLYRNGKITSAEEFLKVVLEREDISETGIENGLAIPHGKSDCVKEAAFVVMKTTDIVADWESMDPDNEVKNIIMLAIPKSEGGSTHLDLLATLMQKMSDEDYTARLFGSITAQELYDNLDYTGEETAVKEIKYTKTIVAVTACPAGIAHTYMSAQALEKAGDEMGVKVYVEKQGANGIEDRHTTENLKNADAAIFAVGVAVKDSHRFEHLPTIKVPVAEPMKNAKAVIESALKKAEQTAKGEYVETETKSDKSSLWEEIKQSVLTGISHIVAIIVAAGMMGAFIVIYRNFTGLGDGAVWGEFVKANPENWLVMLDSFRGLLFNLMVPILSAYMAYSISEKPALAAGFAAGLCANIVGGGFLVGMLGGLVAGYVVRLLKKVIPAKGTFAGFVSFVLYPVLSVAITAVSLLFFIGPPVAVLNTIMFNFLGSLQGTNAALLGAAIGIMVSFDLGGPVNKAAYTFSVTALGQGVLMPYAVFASVKMVSAFAVTIATKVRKDLFTEEEIEVGNSTWMLGLAGITEGAIPFMMADPLRVMLSLCTGSAVAGALVAMFDIGLDVTGAGIFSMFVLTTDNLVLGMAVWFFGAVLGAIISAILLIVTRIMKNKKMARKAANA